MSVQDGEESDATPSGDHVIIFGLSVFYIGLIGKGQFHCPNCGGDREYTHKRARRFFTLFFLPVIPLGTVGEAVRCATCRKRFDPAVLRLPTSAQMSDALLAGARAIAVVMLRAGGTSPSAVSTAVATVRQAGALQYDESQLEADLRLPTEATDAALRTLTTQTALPARESYLASAVRIALADGPLSPAEREAALAIGNSVGLSEAHAQGVIVTVEQSART